jgi:hypothetical protein
VKFAHEDSDWEGLLAIVADTTGRQVALVEKDYWVTHTLWALQEQGFDLWFKGGTSLSKGFDLIERFSEDLDLGIDAGRVPDLQNPVLPWEDNNKKRRAKGIEERQVWFDSLASKMLIPACGVARNPSGSDDRVRSAWFEVTYPAHHDPSLLGSMRPYVLLEVGQARVVPFVERPISSWVHDHLNATGLGGDFTDNRPSDVRCIHPMVTCLEKLEAIARKFDKGKAGADFVRHYEDAARIIQHRDTLPVSDLTVGALAAVLHREDGKAMPSPSHPAFNPSTGDRWWEIERTSAALDPIYWGPRLRLAEATAVLRAFLAELSDLRG